MKKKIHVLILCTGNSCRSQMAEGWGKALTSEVAEFQSAGVEAHGKNPRAIQVMSEVGVDTTNQESTIVNDDILAWADLVITVCGHADEVCPNISMAKEKRHIPFDDPARVTGSEEDILNEFRRVRDEIKQCITALIEEFSSQQNV